MELVCIKCPRGCVLNVNGDTITGNMCLRGVQYAKEELTCPMRTVTALAKGVNGEIIPVKTNVEIPKDKINEVLQCISKCRADKSNIGDVILTNVAGTKANIVVTGESYKVD